MTQGAGPSTGFTTDKTMLVVENNNWADMTMYLIRNGTRMRIGSVPSLGTERFVLSEAMIGGVGDIRILADPIGSSATWLSQPLVVMPGQEVRFRLENNVQLSSYSVR